MRLRWSLRALEQAEAALDYIAEDRPQAAADWLSGLFEWTRMLETLPLQGRVVPEAHRDDLRELIYGSYRIVYRVRGDVVSVLLVHHSRQDFDAGEVDPSE